VNTSAGNGSIALHGDFVFGALVTSVSTMIPDDMTGGTVGKVLVTMAMAALSGFCYAAGKFIWEKLVTKRHT